MISEYQSIFEKDGYVLIENFFNGQPGFSDLRTEVVNVLNLLNEFHGLEQLEDISGISQAINQLVLVDKDISSKLYDTLNRSINLSRLLCSDKVERLCKTFLNCDLVSANNFQLRVQIPGNDLVSGLPWHQDGAFNDAFKGCNGSLVVWGALYDITPDMGPVVFKKGSHRVGILDPIERLKPSGLPTLTVDDSHESLAHCVESAPNVSAGDLVLIDMCTVHRSGSNRSCNTKFSFGARYHGTPSWGKGI